VALLNDATKAYFRARQRILVTEIWQNYPAAAAGLKPGDIVVEADGKLLEKVEDLQALLPTSAEALVELRVLRNRRMLGAKLRAGDATSAPGGQDERRPA